MDRDSANTNGAPAVSNPNNAQPSQSRSASRQQLNDLQHAQHWHSQPRSSESASPPSYGYTRTSQSSNSTRTSPIGPPSHYSSIATTLSNATATVPATAPAPIQNTNDAMAASTMNLPQALPPTQLGYGSYPYLGGRSSDRDAPSYAGMSAESAGAVLHIRGLPDGASEEYVRVMCTFAQRYLQNIEISTLSTEPGSPRLAVVRFTSLQAAREVRKSLNGQNGMTVDFPASVGQISGSSSGGPSSTTSPDVGTAQSSRFEAAFAPFARTSPPNGDNHSLNGQISLPDPYDTYGRSAFSPNSNLRNPFHERNRVTSKALINDATDDDDTGDIIRNPVAYAENGSYSTQRRATAPHIPLTAQMSGLSLNTATNGISTAQNGQSMAYQASSAFSASTMSPTSVNGGGVGYMQPSYMTMNGRPQFRQPPPANPADHNPPCNTLYVGNLPMEASEDELRRIFASQRGYRRMCFRTKPNGPMCFVEFDEIGAATKALNELYGAPLSNSKKGGIRLSFSKNPLGVRANPQPPGAGPSGTLAGAHGMPNQNPNGSGVNPPPGLRMPPGLGGNRSASSYSAASISNGSAMASGNNPLGLGNGSSFSRDPWTTAGGPYFGGLPMASGIGSHSNAGTTTPSPYPNGHGPFSPSKGTSTGPGPYQSSNGLSNGVGSYSLSNGVSNGSASYLASNGVTGASDANAHAPYNWTRHQFGRGQI